MKKILILLLITLFLFSACQPIEQIEKTEDGKTNDPSISQVKSVEDEIKELIRNMTIDEKVGQLLIVGFDNSKVSEIERSLIESNKVGGFILFKRNIVEYEQTLALLNTLKEINSKNKIPLFLSIDEEGGRVSRLNEIFKNMPPASSLGLKNKESLAQEYGKIQASKLKSIGFNLNFSPVLDVNSNPNNKVIGDRAISDDPEIVALLGRQVFKSFMDLEIIPVGKHYPGHGDTVLDSHYNMPIIKKSLKDLEKVEFLPFNYAIKNDIPGLMVGHLYLETISDEPASLSLEIMTKLLRNDQEFKGLIFSDDLTMGAIIKDYEIGDATVKFLVSGGDIALICHGNDNILKAINSIKDALVKGQIQESAIDEKLFRIIKTKKQFNLNNNINNSVDIEGINDRIVKYLEQGE